MKRILPAFTILALAACSAPAAHAPATAPAATTTSSAPPAAPSTVPASDLPGGEVLTCTTVVAPDPSVDNLSVSGLESEGFPAQLNAEQAIGLLEAMTIGDGLVNITAGTPNSFDTVILDAADMSLKNYSTSATKLGTDAQQYASDEESYNPDGPVDASYAKQLLADITTLMGDCHGALKWAMRVLHK
jgi:hypothetical protein